VIAIVVQARLGSQRLPLKSLLPLGDGTVLEQVLKRCRQSKLADQVILTSPDQELLLKAVKLGCGIHRHEGPRNCLTEYFTVARNIKADTIVRVTGDCPCIDPELIDNCIDLYKQTGADYLYGLPDGLDVEVFNAQALFDAHRKARTPEEREHVTVFIRNKPHKYKCLYVSFIKLQTKLSIDTKDDYDAVCMLWDMMPENFRFNDLLKVID
jgi:spore coat polysaccharide biosynthesis protein SpsF